MKHIKEFMIASLVMFSLGLFTLRIPVQAETKDTISTKTCEGIRLATGGEGCEDDGGTNFGGIVSRVINILSILVGAVSVIMLIVGGFRYVISNGDSNATKGAKDTIMYALIGLIIVLFAQVIVRFVWTNASDSTGGGGGTPKPGFILNNLVK